MRTTRRISEIFSPGKPIIRRELLVGRTRQLNRITHLLGAGGRSVVITGARGIGKTSLANIAALSFGNQIETQCHSKTTFSSWALDLLASYGEDVSVIEDVIEKNVGGGVRADFIAAIALSGRRKRTQKKKGVGDLNVTPDVLYRLLEKIDGDNVITVDEFDRIPRRDEKTIELFGDFLKLLGNRSGKHTIRIIFIGVSSSAHRLFNGHPSIKRNVTPIHLRRLTQRAVQEYFNHISEYINYSFSTGVVNQFKIDFLGFPHFVHMVGEFCSMDRDEGDVVTLDIYEKAVDAVLDELLGIESRWDFIRNKSTPEGDAILKEVLANRNMKIDLVKTREKLQKMGYLDFDLREAIKQLIFQQVLVQRGGRLSLADPEMSPFLFVNFRRRRYVSSKQLSFKM